MVKYQNTQKNNLLNTHTQLSEMKEDNPLTANILAEKKYYYSKQQIYVVAITQNLMKPFHQQFNFSKEDTAN